MINPVNNYTQTEYQPQPGRTQKIEGNEQFSLESALNNQNEHDGVIYESSSKSPKEEGSFSPAPRKDSFESTLDEAIATRAEREKETPDPLSTAMYKFFDDVTGFLSTLWKNIKTVFINLWDSKPLSEGVTTGAKQEAATTPSSISEFSDIPDIPDDFVPSSLEELEMARDANIRKALAEGDKEKFQTLLSNGGRKVPARNTDAITTYDASGHIVNINPSDENKILHGDRGVQKL